MRHCSPSKNIASHAVLTFGLSPTNSDRRHKHEIESGRTSSVGLEILGFEASGKPVLPEPIATSSHGADDKEGRKEKLSWEDICKRSAKVVSFIGTSLLPFDSRVLYSLADFRFELQTWLGTNGILKRRSSA